MIQFVATEFYTCINTDIDFGSETKGVFGCV